MKLAAIGESCTRFEGPLCPKKGSEEGLSSINRQDLIMSNNVFSLDSQRINPTESGIVQGGIDAGIGTPL